MNEITCPGGECAFLLAISRAISAVRNCCNELREPPAALPGCALRRAVSQQRQVTRSTCLAGTPEEPRWNWWINVNRWIMLDPYGSRIILCTDGFMIYILLDPYSMYIYVWYILYIQAHVLNHILCIYLCICLLIYGWILVFYRCLLLVFTYLNGFVQMYKAYRSIWMNITSRCTCGHSCWMLGRNG